ncbi:MAG: hypothetical protein GY841_06745 [FCB group bacterium]|nr:hypothetical protein [FCB group bacterium]
MCNTRRIVIGILLVFIVFGFSHDIHSSGEINPLYMLLDPTNVPEKAGLVDLRLSIRSMWNWDTLKVEVTKIDNLEYNGIKSWEVYVAEWDTIDYDINVNIPDMDTSGIIIQLFKDSTSMSTAYRYFVTTGDTLEVYGQKPKAPKVHHVEMRCSSEEAKKPRDSVIYPSGIYEMTDVQKMQDLEKTPLTNSDEQHIMVDGEVWGRLRGEYKFHRVKTVVDPPKFKPAEIEMEADSTYDLILDLRQKDDYEFVKEIIPDLNPLAKTGYYRAVIPKNLLKQIIDRRVRLNAYPDYPDTSGSRESSKKEIPPRDTKKDYPMRLESGDEEMLYFYNFDGDDFGDYWYTEDLNPLNGEEKWGIWHSTESVAYCAWIGDQMWDGHFCLR